MEVNNDSIFTQIAWVQLETPRSFVLHFKDKTNITKKFLLGKVIPFTEQTSKENSRVWVMQRVRVEVVSGPFLALNSMEITAPVKSMAVLSQWFQWGHGFRAWICVLPQANPAPINHTSVKLVRVNEEAFGPGRTAPS